MKVVFVGPTIPDAATLYPGLDVRPPARRGDVKRAVDDGATVIGLIDGYFEYVPAVWHKELLFALSSGLAVFGAASMGALRAAECDGFGMQGIGEIYRQYTSGRRVDDSDVAQLHAPAELGYFGLSEPLVNTAATLEALLQTGAISPQEHALLATAAGDLHFKDRTPQSIVAATPVTAERRTQILSLYRSAHVNQKRLDGLELLECVLAQPPAEAPPRDWQFQNTTMWSRLD